MLSSDGGVHGIDNNMRRHFFGPWGDTRWSRDRLVAKFRNYAHYDIDVRDRAAVQKLVKEIRPEAMFTARRSRVTICCISCI